MEEAKETENDKKAESQLSLAPPAPAGIPSGLQLKLSILGRAFSGKRTIAKMLQEKVGEKSVTIFDMDVIIAEALEYVTPKKVDEATLEAKAKQEKGKKPAGKSTIEETTIMTDKYEGRNAEEYKSIAQSIKHQFFSDFEGELTQKRDLVTLVPDDNLLV